MKDKVVKDKVVKDKVTKDKVTKDKVAKDKVKDKTSEALPPNHRRGPLAPGPP